MNTIGRRPTMFWGGAGGLELASVRPSNSSKFINRLGRKLIGGPTNRIAVLFWGWTGGVQLAWMRPSKANKFICSIWPKNGWRSSKLYSVFRVVAPPMGSFGEKRRVYGCRARWDEENETSFVWFGDRMAVISSWIEREEEERFRAKGDGQKRLLSWMEGLDEIKNWALVWTAKIERVIALSMQGITFGEREWNLWWIERWSNHLVYHQNPTFLLFCVQRVMPPYFNPTA